jgi:hypothetical protein
MAASRPRPELPPTRTIKPVDPPPSSGRPTSAQLKADIDSGRTGDKVGVFDPGLATLGTDDEAAGRPPSPEAIAAARRQEGPERWTGAGPAPGAQRGRRSFALYGFLVLVAFIAIAFLSVLTFR